ncbi:albusnodin/ikarugamycin family macrolactam cyclase [Streptomyces capoamus]|uniref:albusnodin/ikarugamycin family macrolactam cyclase n=1 Tax=Streptomyces capoamus TaxID=68183 RepID=UPI003C2BD5D9
MAAIPGATRTTGTSGGTRSDDTTGTPGAATGTVRDAGGLGVRLPAGPAIAGLLPPDRLPAPAAQVWATDPRLWAWGAWHAGEVRTAATEQARVVAVGQCLAGSAQMQADLERSARDGDWESLLRWPGAYLLLVLERGGRFTAFTDPAGQFPLYYTRCNGRTVVSTRATAVAALTGRERAPDTLALAAHLVCPAVPELVGTRTAFTGVHRLGPGEVLRVDPATDAVTRTACASPGPHADTRRDDAAARLREALREAVTLRVRDAPRLTCDFSGGLDSTSLAFLAAHAAEEPLDAFVYHHPEAPAGDLEHAVRHARASDAIRLRLTVGGDTSLPYAALHTRGRPDQPDPSTAVIGRLRCRLTHIASRGGGVHLTGEGGDALLTAPPSHLGEVAASRAVRRLACDALALGRLRRVAPAGVARRAVWLARTPIDRALHDLAAHLEQPLAHPPRWLDAIAWWPPPGPETSWLTTRARRELAELAGLAAERAAQARREMPDPGPGPGTRAALVELLGSAQLHGHLVDVARPLGVWPQAPFLDGAVVRAAMSLPVPAKADPYTVKPLLRAALAGAVPDAVLDRRTKGAYAAEDYRGVRRAAADLRVRLARSPLADLGVVEPTRVVADLDAAAHGLAAPFPALNRLLGVDVWLDGLGTAGEAP